MTDPTSPDPAHGMSMRISPRLYFYEGGSSGRTSWFAALLSPQELAVAGGLPRAAVVGTTSMPGPLDPEFFLPNPLFTDLLQEVVSATALRVPEWRRAAVSHRTGRVSLWDGRAIRKLPEDSRHDVLGKLRVRDARRVGYEANPDYLPFSRNGLFALPQVVVDELLARLRELRVAGPLLLGEH